MASVPAANLLLPLADSRLSHFPGCVALFQGHKPGSLEATDRKKSLLGGLSLPGLAWTPHL